MSFVTCPNWDRTINLSLFLHTKQGDPFSSPLMETDTAATLGHRQVVLESFTHQGNY